MTHKTKTKLSDSATKDTRAARQAALAQVMSMGEGVVYPDEPVALPTEDIDSLASDIDVAYLQVSIGQLLETARSKRKVGKRELSRKLDTNHARISQLEGATNLELKSIVQVLHSLDYDLELHLVSRTDGEVIRARV